ncbi:MAG: hypothetical protein SFY81_11345 [Verrucomicrobiota bacterium]|nr:hypothetical protein [Verrucomicrobiota bacterium]
MLVRLTDLYTFRLETRDGKGARLKDVYFDDRTWGIQFFVVAPLSRGPYPLLLLLPNLVRASNLDNRVLSLGLNETDLLQLLPISTARPVCKQYEQVTNGYAIRNSGNNNPHLRSCVAITGYSFRSGPESRETLADFAIQSSSWAIELLLTNFLRSVEPAAVKQISWASSSLFLKPACLNSPLFQRSHSIISSSPARSFPDLSSVIN